MFILFLPKRVVQIAILSTLCCLSLPLMADEIEDLRNIPDPSKPLFINPNDLTWKKALESLPPGAEMIYLVGRPDQAGPLTLRFKFPAYYQLSAHWYSNDQNITVISGSLNIGMGDKLNVDKGKMMPVGSFIRIPAKMHVFSWFSEETVLQYHGSGPWDIQFLPSSGKKP